MQILDGAVKNYNATAPAEQKIQHGDCLIGVNGSRGNTEAMEKLITGAALRLELDIRRSGEFTAFLDKTAPTAGAKTFGLNLEYITGGRSLLVQSVQDGLAREW